MNKLNHKLIDLILSHDNDYKFNIETVLHSKKKNRKTVSIVIPYYNSAKTINLLLKYLFIALDHAEKNSTAFTYQVLVIDDGSKIALAEDIILKKFQSKVKIVRLKNNYGRSYARNVGLNMATKDITVFLDSDIVVSKSLILNHLKIQDYSNKPVITANTFHFCTFDNLNPVLTELNRKEFKMNDFRIHCTYQNSWIGCDNDKKFIGKKFNIISDTDDFKKWPIGRLYGPWLITNMVLGGLFSVDTKLAKFAGMDLAFDEYGFTETPLVTKLIALGSRVVPVANSVALHINEIDSLNIRKKKDILFQKAHKKYFNTYLNQTLKEALG